MTTTTTRTTPTSERRLSRLAVAGGVELGSVLRPHGQSGRLLIQLHAEQPAALLRAPEVLLRGPPGATPYRVQECVPLGSRPPRVRLRLAGIDSRERAEIWSGAALEVAEADLPLLEPGEFYWRDLIGLRCVTADGRELGDVAEILETGANDVLVVARDGEADPLLIPALDSVLVDVDLQRGRITVELPSEGLP